MSYWKFNSAVTVFICAADFHTYLRLVHLTIQSFGFRSQRYYLDLCAYQKCLRKAVEKLPLPTNLPHLPRVPHAMYEQFTL